MSCAKRNTLYHNGMCRKWIMMASSRRTLRAMVSRIGERVRRIVIGNVGRALSAAIDPRGAARVAAIRHASAPAVALYGDAGGRHGRRHG